MLCYLLLFLCNVCILHTHGQKCDGINEYQACSLYSGCLCFYKAYPPNASICVDGFSLSYDELIGCEGPVYECQDSEHECIYHRQCQKDPICYPVPNYNEHFCPPPGTITTTTTTTTTETTSTTTTTTTITTTTTTTTTVIATTTTTTIITTTTTATTITKTTTASATTTTTTTTVTTTTTTTKQTQGIPNIPANATWKQNATTVAGGNGKGNATNQLKSPSGLFVDNDQTVIITEHGNHRIVQWKKDDTDEQVIAGGNSQGNRLDQLNDPTDVLIDEETDSLIIADWQNHRVVRWSHRNGTKHGEILIDTLNSWGLAMDDQRYLYVSVYGKHEVRRYRLGHTNGTIVVGGNGKGNGLNQLDFPTYLFVDRQQNVYVSDNYNHRVMKWNKGAIEGIVVAGGNGNGDALIQLSYPHGITVDTLGTLYVADTWNHRVMRWFQEEEQGTVIVGGNGEGAGANQFNFPVALSFDRHGNLYVIDAGNDRVQRFDIIN